LDVVTLTDRAAGCLLGGALGDALGAPVEFLQLTDIQRRYGPQGITEPPRPALITDDTQLTLFTAEGMLLAAIRGRHRGLDSTVEQVWYSYRRWLRTQQQSEPDEDDVALLDDPRLFASRAPGLTNLRALRDEQLPRSPRTHPRNDARSCGGVVRMAPAGFTTSAADAYALGCECAALTHGHPTGWAPAGALALLVHLLAVRNRPLDEAVDQVIGRVMRDDLETAHTLSTAVRLAETDNAAAWAAQEARINGQPVPDGGPSVRSLELLGSGWLGHEALAIAVYVALTHPRPGQFVDALRMAANHSGDSDSTASITGNILGALHGTGVLPRDWVNRLELAEVITQVGADLAAELCGVAYNEDHYLIA